MNRYVESDLLSSVRLLAIADIYSSQFEEEKSQFLTLERWKFLE